MALAPRRRLGVERPLVGAIPVASPEGVAGGAAAHGQGPVPPSEGVAAARPVVGPVREAMPAATLRRPVARAASREPCDGRRAVVPGLPVEGPVRARVPAEAPVRAEGPLTVAPNGPEGGVEVKAPGPDGREGAEAAVEAGPPRAAARQERPVVVGELPAVALAVAPEVPPGPTEEAVRRVLLAGEDACAAAERPVRGADGVVPAPGATGRHLAPATKDEAAGGAARRAAEEAGAAG